MISNYILVTFMWLSAIVGAIFHWREERHLPLAILAFFACACAGLMIIFTIIAITGNRNI